MRKDEILQKLEGLQTVETVMEKLGITRQSAVNLLSRLKKEQHVTVQGGGRLKRLYKVTMRRQLPRVPGMFDIINKYSPHMKLNPWYDHQVHGVYGPEEALVDALKTKSSRVILASMQLFAHITDWKKLYRLGASDWQNIGALYDVAKMFFKVRKMPDAYHKPGGNAGWAKLTQLHTRNFPAIAQKWKVYIPFNEQDIKGVVI